MPQKNRRFPFVADAYYHIYNRGIDKKPIFLDEKDYWIFRRIVREKLLDAHEILLDTFALLPNHFHLLLHQESERDITHFMRSISVRYAMYFKKKYDQDGSLFGCGYRAAWLQTEEGLERTRRYILKNPINAGHLEWKHVGKRV